MNRIQLATACSASAPAEAPWSSAPRLASPCRHSLFVPQHYEPKYAYPLVVWLHGDGGGEHQLRRIMPALSLRNYVAVAPRAADEVDGSELASFQQTEAAIDAAAERIAACIDLADDRCRIRPDRIFLVGYQGGGTMALRLALRDPARYAGVASLGGPLPLGGRPLARVNELRSLPILLAHGRESEIYDEDRVCDDLRLLHSAGISVTLRQYPGGDDLTTHMLGDANTWMMEIVTGAYAAVEESASA